MKFNGITASVNTWIDTRITANVPASATSGNVVVTVGGVASNGLNFTVQGNNNPPSGISAYLQSATNPENGTVTFTYNSYNNKLATKTDAKGQQVRYTYDGLARLTEVHRFNSSMVEDTCQQEIYS